MAATRFIIGDEHWDYDSSKLGFQEAVALEKNTGLTLGDLEQRAEKGSVEAIGALLWLAQRRAGVKVKWSDLEFDFNALQVVDVDDDGNVIPDKPAEDADPSVDAPAA